MLPEQAAEQPGAGIGDFVEREARLGDLGKDRQQTRPGRRLENEIGRCQGGRFGGDKAER